MTVCFVLKKMVLQRVNPAASQERMRREPLPAETDPLDLSRVGGWQWILCLIDWVSHYYLWIVREWAAGPSDTLDFLDDIANLKFRGLIDSKLRSAGVQYLRAASWFWLDRDSRTPFLIPWFLPPWYFSRNYPSCKCKIRFSLLLRHIFEIQFPQMSVPKKKSAVLIRSRANRRKSMTSVILSEALRVSSLEIMFKVCTTYHMKTLWLYLHNIMLSYSCLVMLMRWGQVILEARQ